jgi:hypothetical protein
MIAMFISIFEVNTEGIANSWGDEWDTYLPVEQTRDPIQSQTVSPDQVVNPFSPQTRWQTPRLFTAVPTALASGQRCWLWLHCLFERCCQWRI